MIRSASAGHSSVAASSRSKPSIFGVSSAAIPLTPRCEIVSSPRHLSGERRRLARRRRLTIGPRVRQTPPGNKIFAFDDDQMTRNFLGPCRGSPFHKEPHMKLSSFVESLEPRRLFAGTPAGNVFAQTNLVSDGAVTAAHTD